MVTVGRVGVRFPWQKLGLCDPALLLIRFLSISIDLTIVLFAHSSVLKVRSR